MDSGNNNQKHDNNSTDDIFDIIKKKHEQANNIQSTPKSVPDGTKQFDAAKAKAAQPPQARTRVDTEAVKPKPQTTGHNTSQTPSAPKKTEATPVKTYGGISLDDFSEFETKSQKQKKKKPAPKKQSTGLLSGISKIIIYLILVFGISIYISISTIKIANDVFAFVKPDEEITVTIPEGASTKQVAKILKENGVINHPFIYRLYTEFRISKRAYLTGEYEAGEHVVNPMMNYDKLLLELSHVETTDNSVVRIMIPEGYTINEILELFEKNGMKKKEEFMEALQEFEYDYKFMSGLTKEELSEYRFDTNYGYRLEGYLFPDTYDFYVDENPISVISKLLDNFDRKFDEKFYERCEELGYTVDEIITIASMIEREGNNVHDYSKISSVFHNRLKNSASYPFLDSDATIQYALGGHKAKLEKGDTDIVHPYNTYKNRGLPPGAIANPGYEAIYAALYPESTPYYYFLSRSDGVTVYSRTYQEHQRAIEESNRIDAKLKAQNG